MRAARRRYAVLDRRGTESTGTTSCSMTTARWALARRYRAILGVGDDLLLVEVATAVDFDGEACWVCWVQRFLSDRLEGLRDRPGRGRKPVFSPEGTMYVVKIACERPDDVGRSLSRRGVSTENRGQKTARRPGNVDLGGDGSSDPAAPSSQALAAEDVGFRPARPRDAAFAAQIQGFGTLYTRPLRPDEIVLCVDEMTSLQPRPRRSPTRATKKDRPTLVEHEYGRCGALNLFAAFDTRTGIPTV